MKTESAKNVRLLSRLRTLPSEPTITIYTSLKLIKEQTKVQAVYSTIQLATFIQPGA